MKFVRQHHRYRIHTVSHKVGRGRCCTVTFSLIASPFNSSMLAKHRDTIRHLFELNLHFSRVDKSKMIWIANTETLSCTHHRFVFRHGLKKHNKSVADFFNSLVAVTLIYYHFIHVIISNDKSRHVRYLFSHAFLSSLWVRHSSYSQYDIYKQ